MTHGTGAGEAPPGEAPAPKTLGRAWMRRSRQALGPVLIVLAFVPVYRLMDTSGDAPHRQVSVEVAEVTLQLALPGLRTLNHRRRRRVQRFEPRPQSPLGTDASERSTQTATGRSRSLP